MTDVWLTFAFLADFRCDCALLSCWHVPRPMDHPSVLAYEQDAGSEASVSDIAMRTRQGAGWRLYGRRGGQSGVATGGKRKHVGTQL
jgi:hypothetical protein